MKRFRYKIRLCAFRDRGEGEFDSRREFSEPYICWADLKTSSVTKVIGDTNAFGSERAQTHVAKMRFADIDVFTYLEYGGKFYRVLGVQTSVDLKFMELSLAFEKECTREEMSNMVFSA